MLHKPHFTDGREEGRVPATKDSRVTEKRGAHEWQAFLGGTIGEEICTEHEDNAKSPGNYRR